MKQRQRRSDWRNKNSDCDVLVHSCAKQIFLVVQAVNMCLDTRPFQEKELLPSTSVWKGTAEL